MPSIRAPEHHLRLALLGAEILLSAGEGLFVVYPLLLFFPGLGGHHELLPVLGAALAVWCTLLLRGLAPIVKGADGEDAPRRYRLAQRLPRRTMTLRLMLWGLLALGASLYLIPRGVLVPWQISTVLAICLVHSLALSLMRWALHKRLLRTYLGRRHLNPPMLQLMTDTLLDRLTEVALVLGAVTAGSLSPFVMLFVPISLEQFMLMETYFPWTGVVLGAVWYFVVVPRQARPLVRYLGQAAAGATPAAHLLHQAHVNVHRLPLTLALWKIGFFMLGAALLLVQSLLLYQFSLLEASLVFFAIVVATLGTGVYEMLWSRAVLRPEVAYLLSRKIRPGMPVGALSLQAKMMLAFGGAVVFTVALAFFWTYLQYGNLRRDFAVTQARRELKTVRRALGIDPARIPAAMAARLARIDVVQGSHYLHVPQTGAAPALLPSTAVATVRRRDQGILELSGRHLAGCYERVDSRRPSLGSLVVLLPVGESANFALNLQVMIFFFLIVLAVSLGVVLMTSADLTGPLVRLEQRASAMAGGALDMELLPMGELDEIGRLTDAFEQMRLALQQKIATIEQLNVGLEEKVQQRTGELERSNDELKQAIIALQEAQQRLVTSEKLASIGQLVAGIAHEINNPINAVINSVNPLLETVNEVVQNAGKDDHAVAEARQDLEAMLRVIRSGVERTQRIVQALRNYSRQDSEQRSVMDLNTDIEETLALLQHQLRGIDVQQRLEARPQLWAFRGQLNQAVMNLLANAAAALQDVEHPRILISTRDLDRDLVLKVEDNGPGIPANVLTRIFDPFFTTKEVGKGTGLGLSITHRVAERHGGKLGVHSEPGQTIFAMIIPREDPVPPASAAADERPSAAS